MDTRTAHRLRRAARDLEREVERLDDEEYEVLGMELDAVATALSELGARIAELLEEQLPAPG